MPASDPGVRVLAPPPADCADILSPRALAFLAALARRFEPERQRLLARRRERQQDLDAGRVPDFLRETKEIRDRDWTVAPIRPDLTDRRVEITGPVERKMMINALNSGANVFMADFEDANAPTWENNVRGQQNVRDAVTRTIAYTSPEGKRYALERSEEHTSELQSQSNLVCRLLLENKNRIEISSRTDVLDGRFFGDAG